MRTYRVNFNLEQPFPDGKSLGNIGEKNASQLIITPPAEITDNDDIISIMAAFSTVRGAVRLGPFEKAETITVPLVSSLTVGYSLSLQLEAFDGEGKLILKSPLLGGMTFGAAVTGPEAYPSLGNDSLSGLIGSHTHQNFQVLKGLSEENGMLYYNGSAIGSKKTKTVELQVGSQCDAYIDSPVSGTINFIAFEGVPAGAEIVSVEIKADVDGFENKWIDIRDFIWAQSHFPYVIGVHRSFYSEDYVGVCVSVVYFVQEISNDFYSTIAAIGIQGMRVTYVDESGEA